MNATTTEERVIQVLSSMLNKPVEALRPELSLAQDLGLDSVDLLGLVTGMEEEFDVVFPGDSNMISQVKTIRELVALVEEHLQ